MKQKRGFKGITLISLLYTLCSARARAEMQQQYLGYILFVKVPTESCLSMCTEGQFLFQSMRNQSIQIKRCVFFLITPDVVSRRSEAQRSYMICPR